MTDKKLIEFQKLPTLTKLNRLKIKSLTLTIQKKTNMRLEEKIMEQLKTAMKAKDEAALRTLRAIKAQIIIVKTSEGAGGEIKEDEEPKLLQKMLKQRKDSIEIFTSQNRLELAKIEQDEVAIIEQFLPKQLTEAEITEHVKVTIAELGAISAADMGKVMGAANKKMAGQADGKVISAIVKTLLS